MARLFLGNFDFEHRLAVPNYQPSMSLKRFNAELASSWLATADDGDWLWTPSPIEPEFFSSSASAELPRVIPTMSLADVPQDVTCVPWGWSSEIRKYVDRFGWTANAPCESAVRQANSRATSEYLERTWSVGLAGARRIECFEEFQQTLHSLRSFDQRWVVKAEFGMSARERILGQGRASESNANWVRRRLACCGVVFFEPWVERVNEWGIQIDIPATGPAKLIGVTPMCVDRRGQYAGSWFLFDRDQLPLDDAMWSGAIDVALRAASHLQSFGYFGPLGIDAMSYRDFEGELRIRPLQDLNARWTMGRLSLDLRRIAQSAKYGLWQHGPVESFRDDIPFEVNRVISTSPRQVAEQRCQHASRIVIST